MAAVVSAARTEIGSLLETRSGFREGRPCLAATGMTVHGVAALFQSGMAPDEILAQFPHLDLPRIYAALAYYLANKADVEADLERDRQWGASMAEAFPDGWTDEPLSAAARHPQSAMLNT